MISVHLCLWINVFGNMMHIMLLALVVVPLALSISPSLQLKIRLTSKLVSKNARLCMTSARCKVAHDHLFICVIIYCTSLRAQFFSYHSLSEKEHLFF